MKTLLHLRPTCSNILATKVTLFSLYQTFLPFFYIDVTFAGVNRRDVFVPIAGRALHSPRRPAPCGRAALHSPGQGVPWRALSLRVRRSLHVAGRWTARGARSFHIGCLNFHIAGRSFTHRQFSFDRGGSSCTQATGLTDGLRERGRPSGYLAPASLTISIWGPPAVYGFRGAAVFT